MQFLGNPFIRLLLFLLAGIFASRLFQSVQVVYLLLGMFLLLLVNLWFQSIRFSFGKRWITGLGLLLGIFWAGLSLGVLFQQQVETHLPRASAHAWMGTLKTSPAKRAKKVKMEVEIETCVDSVFELSHPVKILLYLPADSLSANLQTGSRLVFSGNFTRPLPPQNPDAFDYAAFLNRKGIQYVVYSSDRQWKALPSFTRGSLHRFFDAMRFKLLRVLQNNGLSGQSYAVAAAILLGDDDLIDPEVRHNYAGAGAVHILCVSGMHVGILFLLFGQLLFFLNRIKGGPMLKNALLVMIIWAYALLTGLSPSVSRAATMISLFVAADSLQRAYNPYNVLAASAFVLLLFKPMLIYQVGFQLSFAAVLGIILFYRPLFQLFYIKNKLLRIVWGAMVVSVSAQAVAFPIAAHYFHLFPNYFILTNLTIFGLAYLILASGLTLLGFAWFPVLAKWLGTMLGSLVLLLNKMVEWIAGLPGAVTENLYFPWLKVLLIELFLVMLYETIRKKQARHVMGMLFVALLLAGYQTLLRFDRLKQHQMVVFSVRGHTAIDFVDGKNAVLLADSALLKQSKTLEYATRAYHIKHGLEVQKYSLEDSIKMRWIYHEGGLIDFGEKKYFVLNPKYTCFPSMRNKIKLDLLIYRGKKYVAMEELRRTFDFHQLLLDNSVSSWLRKKLIAECKKFNIKYIDVSQSGAKIF